MCLIHKESMVVVLDKPRTIEGALQVAINVLKASITSEFPNTIKVLTDLQDKINVSYR